MRTVRSHNPEHCVEECDKIVSSCADNKRYIEETNETFAFGHYKIPNFEPNSKMPVVVSDPNLSFEEKDFIVTSDSNVDSS